MGSKVSVVIEHDDHGYYAWCPELPGCQTQGDTLQEAVEFAREAIEVYLESLTPEARAMAARRK